MKEPGHIRHVIWGIDKILYLCVFVRMTSMTTESKPAEYYYARKWKGINHFVSMNEDTLYFPLIFFHYNNNGKHYDILLPSVCVCAGRGCEGRRTPS